MPYTNTTPALPFVAGSYESREAAIRAVKGATPQAAMILGWFVIRGEIGGTQKEASEQCGYGRPTICARVHEMEKSGLLVKTASRRNGCRVYRSREIA